MPRRDPIKNKEYQAKWYKLHKETQFKRIKDRGVSIRNKLKEYKSTLSCSICKENHPNCLDFHHLDPSKKETDISLAVKRGWGWEKIMEEVSKCIVICSNCHRKLHYNEQTK